MMDPSVEAAWDFNHHCWREDVIDATRDMGPALIRWPGGLFTRYYRWKEGVGPRNRRRPMINLFWGGTESNQVGTREFVGLCRQVGADPLIAVNFEADGMTHLASAPDVALRPAGPTEAAEWVDYCNNPSNPQRRRHGVKDPYNVGLWQLGNEISYMPEGLAFDCETAARRTAVFARAMRKRDPGIGLIGWGANGWAKTMMEIAGEHLQYLAVHNLFGVAKELRRNSPLNDRDYRRDPAKTWEYLMAFHSQQEKRLAQCREELAPYGVPLAMTECSFNPSRPNRHMGDVLSTWGAGVGFARMLNVNERNGDFLKIVNTGLFCGSRLQLNTLMMRMPHIGATTYLMPVAHVLGLYRRHTGRRAADVTATPSGLDVTASRTGRRVFLHVANTRRTRSLTARLSVAGMRIQSGRVFTLAADPEFEVMDRCPDILSPVEQALPRDRCWRFPAASVSAVELKVVPVKE